MYMEYDYDLLCIEYDDLMHKLDGENVRQIHLYFETMDYTFEERESLLLSAIEILRRALKKMKCV